MNDLSKDNLHHAYILEGERESIYQNLCQFISQDLDFKIKSNPDFWYEEMNKFSVLDARKLREMQLRKTTHNGMKIFIISFNFITREAQNALLKVLEEPTNGTHIFLITLKSHIFLDTVLSRVVTIKSESILDDSLARKFIKSIPKERINLISKLTEDIKKERLSKSDALKLVQSIKNSLHKDLIKNRSKTNSDLIHNITKIEDYLGDNSASVKNLLEYIAVSI